MPYRRIYMHLRHYQIVSFSTTLLLASILLPQIQLAHAGSKSPYDAGYDHGCDDADISNPSDRYINQPEKGLSFHTDEFMQGYNAGYNDCSDDSGDSQSATDETFKVNVVLTGVDSLTGKLNVCVTPSDGDIRCRAVDPFSDSRAGTVDLEDFVFNTDENPVLGKFQVCVAYVYPPYEQNCAAGVNNPQHASETVTIEVPTGIGRPNSQNNLPSQNTDESSSGSGIGETNPLTNNRYYEGYDWTRTCNDAHNYGFISQPCDTTLITPDGNALTSQGKQVMEDALCPRGQGVIKILELVRGPIPDNLENELATACGW